MTTIPGRAQREDLIHDARRVAIEAIVRIDDEGAYANLVLPRLLDATDLDERDRGFATRLVYGSTRGQRALDHVVDRFLLSDPPAVARAALRVGAHQLIELGTPPHAAVSATVAATPKRYRGLVNAVLRKVAQAAEQGIEFPDEATELSYPDWIVERLRADLGTETASDVLATMNQPAATTVRADGYVQDPSSQLVVEAVPLRSGAVVFDMCASPGGKASALRRRRDARVVAADLRPSRVRLLRGNAEVFSLDDLHLVRADGRYPPFAPHAFDAVLVDAPCSGLGALRRRPDARWRILEADVDRLAALQQELLLAAAPLVRPGGALVYSVCTLTRRETTDVAAAAARSTEFAELTLDPTVGEPWSIVDGIAMLLPTPETDGMGLAIWRRA